MAYFKKGAQLERMSQGVVNQLQNELSLEEKDDLSAEEIASLSDTVAVMNSGKLSQRLRGDMVNLENLGLLLGGSSLEGGDDHA